MPSDTQSTLLIATEHNYDVVKLKSVQTFNLHDGVVVEFVLVELDVTQKQSPSVPI